ncbi:MAG: response regulator [Sulfuricurvum sp.]|nr:response regulator [Sulfuricurvum sp.]
METARITNTEQSTASYSVLVIDPDKTFNDLLTQQLAGGGCEITQCIDTSTIADVLTHPYDYIIIDPSAIPNHLFDVCRYLNTPDASGIIVCSEENHFDQRDFLFSCGILEFFSKNGPIELTASEILSLFQSIECNSAYHITLITPRESLQKSFEKLVRHRNYQLCFLQTPTQAVEKWNQCDHRLSDLLVIDVKRGEDIQSVFDCIHFLRIHKISDTPILLLCNFDDPILFARLYRMGVNNIVSEPYSSEKLLSKITRHLDYRVSKKLLSYEQSLSSQLKIMIDSSSIVSKADPKGIITYVNEEFCRVTGYTEAELIGKPHNIVRHPDAMPILFEQMWETIQNKKIFHGIIMNRRKDGSTYYVDSTIAPIVDDNDTIIEYISIRHDVTALIEKQYEIEAQRRRIQNVMDAQTGLICMVDKKEGIRQSNHRFLEFLGIASLTQKHLRFNHLHDLFIDIDSLFQIKKSNHYEWLDQLYQLRGKFIKIAMRDTSHNHNIFSVHVEKIQDSSYSDQTCYIVTFENVTELNRALREAKAASEAESRFLATMSHEIRTPLNGILGFTELLKETSLDEQQQKYLHTIEYSGETLRQIINNILEVMKLEKEKIVLHNDILPIIPELESIISSFYPLAAKKGIELLVFIDPKLPIALEADSLRLRQILINLIGNAIKFTPQEKRIHIRIKELKRGEGDITVSFTVADEGIGIKSEQKKAIFEPFVQADNSIARRFGGSGLGLNIVSHLINAAHGAFSLKSTYGKGSVFNTTLTFVSELKNYDYQCASNPFHLYLPMFTQPSAKFHLVERYLLRFSCCKDKIKRISTFRDLPDHPSSYAVLFLETISIAEVVTLTKYFKEVTFFIIPPSTSDTQPSALIHERIVWVSQEISWSSIANVFQICYQQPYLAVTKTPNVRFDGLRFLVVEDNEVNRFYIEELLRQLSIQYDMAHDGYEAVKKFINGSYDLVLMDINMPNLDGITATQQILRYEQEVNASHTPIIGLSADAIEKNISEYLQKGLDGYLVKPLSKNDLVTLLKDFFSFRAEPFEEDKGTMESDMHLIHGSLLSSIRSKLELPEEVVLLLFQKFIDNASTLLSQLNSNHDNPDELKKTLHALKGIAKNLFLELLGKMCEELEHRLGEMSTQERNDHIQKIHYECTTIINRMQKELLE